MDKRKFVFFFKGVKFSLADHIHKCHLLDYNLKFHLDLLPVKKCSFNLCQGEVWTENWNGANRRGRGRGRISKLLGGKSTTLLPKGNTPTFTSLKGTPINFPSGGHSGWGYERERCFKKAGQTHYGWNWCASWGGRCTDSNLRWGELKAAASYGFKIQATHF